MRKPFFPLPWEVSRGESSLFLPLYVGVDKRDGFISFFLPPLGVFVVLSFFLSVDLSRERSTSLFFLSLHSRLLDWGRSSSSGRT